MTREQKIEAATMLIDGHSLQRVGDKLGISRQAVHQGLKALGTRVAHSQKLASGCVYPELAKAIKARDLSATDICEILEGVKLKTGSYHSRWLKKRVSGRVPFTANEWFTLSREFAVPLDRLMSTEGDAP